MIQFNSIITVIHILAHECKRSIFLRKGWNKSEKGQKYKRRYFFTIFEVCTFTYATMIIACMKDLKYVLRCIKCISYTWIPSFSLFLLIFFLIAFNIFPCFFASLFFCSFFIFKLHLFSVKYLSEIASLHTSILGNFK